MTGCQTLQYIISTWSCVAEIMRFSITVVKDLIQHSVHFIVCVSGLQQFASGAENILESVHQIPDQLDSLVEWPQEPNMEVLRLAELSETASQLQCILFTATLNYSEMVFSQNSDMATSKGSFRSASDTNTGKSAGAYHYCPSQLHWRHQQRAEETDLRASCVAWTDQTAPMLCPSQLRMPVIPSWTPKDVNVYSKRHEHLIHYHAEKQSQTALVFLFMWIFTLINIFFFCCVDINWKKSERIKSAGLRSNLHLTVICFFSSCYKEYFYDPSAKIDENKKIYFWKMSPFQTTGLH